MPFCPMSEDCDCHEDCAWWCEGEKECSVKMIAINLVKIEESLNDKSK